MSRPLIATLAGVLGFLLYVVAVVTLADLVLRLHWTVQLVYFAAVGVLWVWPARALMVWAAGARG